MIEPLMLAAMVADDFLRILNQNLVGVYAHGSLAFGCYHKEISDIDLLVVVQREPGQAEKEAMIRVLLEREREAPEKGFEMSVVPYEACQNFSHPATYYLHYSEKYRVEAAQNLSGFCRNMRGKDRDLAAHFTVARYYGLCLRGKPASQVFLGVPEGDYIDALEYDIDTAENDVRIFPVTVILNLCRVLAFAEGGYVVSKSQGGRWALTKLEGRWRDLVHEALIAYCAGETTEVPDDAEDFCHYMRLRIDSGLFERKQKLPAKAPKEGQEQIAAG